MIDKIKKKVLWMLDLESDKSNQGIYIAVPLIGILIGKSMGQYMGISFAIVIDVLLAVSTIIQLVRKDRSKKKFLMYLGATIFAIYMTINVWLIQYYATKEDARMVFNIIKIFLVVLSIIIDLLLITVIKNKRTPKSKKIGAMICIISMSVIALLGIVFLPPKGM